MSNGVQLDQEQLSAVEATERAIAILAGPGSGKTRVLSYRARYLLTSDAGSQALLLTFTNKAAAEMKARALAAVNVSSSRIHAHTYHSLCQRILRSHGSLVGIDANFEVMDDQEQQDFAARAARSAGVHNLAKQWSKQRVRRRLPSRQVAEFGAVYEEAKREACVVDFDDLIVYTGELFQRYPEVAEAYGAKYRHLLIDEFQDTNASQFAVVRTLADRAQTVSVFADDDQAIFRFAGAEVENIRLFCEELQARVYPLTTNYRCREAIVACANRLILGAGSGREMRAHKLGGEVRLRVFRTMEEEASALLAEIQSLVSGGLDPASIAVLVRSGYRAEVLLSSLRSSGLPITDWLTRSEESSARRALRACLSVIRPSLGNKAVKDLCEIFSLVDNGERTTDAFLTHFSGCEGVAELAALRKIAIEDGSLMVVVSTAQECLEAVAPELSESVGTLVQTIEALHSYDADFSLDHVLSELALLGSSGPPTAVSGIKVASLHRTKGLQWPHVYLLGLENGHMPDYRAVEEEQLREERRLCFVGVCRTEDQLTLTRVRQSQGWDKPPSPYLAEMQACFSQ